MCTSRSVLMTIYRLNRMYNRRNHTICERWAHMARCTRQKSRQLSTHQLLENAMLKSRSKTNVYFRHTFTESKVNKRQPVERKEDIKMVGDNSTKSMHRAYLHVINSPHRLICWSNKWHNDFHVGSHRHDRMWWLCRCLNCAPALEFVWR